LNRMSVGQMSMIYQVRRFIISSIPARKGDLSHDLIKVLTYHDAGHLAGPAATLIQLTYWSSYAQDKR